MELSNGHSSQIRGWLIVANDRFELSQVGPDSCILRAQALVPAGVAQVTIDVDGRSTTSAVCICNKTSGPSRLVNFEPVDETCSLAEDQA